MKRKDRKKLFSFIKKHRSKGMASFRITTTNEDFIISTMEWNNYPKETLRLKY